MLCTLDILWVTNYRDLDTCKPPEKLRQADVADGRAETADTFDRAEFLRTKQEQMDGSTSLNVL